MRNNLDYQPIFVTQGKQRAFVERTLVQGAALIHTQSGLKHIGIIADYAQGLVYHALAVGKDIDIIPAGKLYCYHCVISVKCIGKSIFKLVSHAKYFAVLCIDRKIHRLFLRRGREHIAVLGSRADKPCTVERLGKRRDVLGRGDG